MPQSRRFERETVIRWDLTGDDAVLGTADPVSARRWCRKGYSVDVTSRHADGSPAWWTTRVPKRAISLRALVDGRIPVRKGGTPPRRNGMDSNKAERSSQLTASGPDSFGPQRIAGVDAKKEPNGHERAA